MNRQFNYSNKYIPPYVEYLSLPWYEKDGLMSYIEALKCEQFKNDPQGHFERAKVINFDMIHAQARGESVDKVKEEPFKTVREKDIQGYTNRDSIVSSAIRTRRKDLYLEKKLVKHFKKGL